MKIDPSRPIKATFSVGNEQEQRLALGQKVSELQSSTHSMIGALKEEFQDVRIVVADIKAIKMNDPEIISSEESTP